jgi:branched-chain amino acid transport system substrate-binding protein
LATGALLAGPAVQAHDIVIGASMAKTGRYATLARATETAIDIAVEEINAAGGVNGHPIKLVKFDTGGDPKQAVAAVRRFAQDEGALAVIGPFASGEARVAFPAGERLGIVQMPNASSAPKLPDKFSYAFRMTESEFTQTIRLVNTMKKKGIPMKTGAIFYASDEFVSKIVGTVIMKTVLTKFGVKLVSDPIGFPNAAFDLSPQVSQIRGKDVDIVAVGAIIQPAVKLKQEMDRQGIKARLIGSQLFADPGVEKTFGAAGDGTLFATSYWYKRNERTRAFNKKYVALNKKRGINKPWPHHVDASAYDSVYIFKKAMEIAGITGDKSKLKAERTAIRDALKDITYSGITGDICFESTGDAQLGGYIIELKNQQWTLLDSHPPAPCTK